VRFDETIFLIPNASIRSSHTFVYRFTNIAQYCESFHPHFIILTKGGKNMMDDIKRDAALLGAIAGFLWGEPDGLLLALISFISIDYLTGVIVGFVTKQLSSNAGFIGLARKGLILAIVAVGHIVDVHVLGSGTSVFRSAVIGFYLANEGMSIIENTAKLGMPFPDKLKEAFKQLKGMNQDENKED